MKKEQKAMQLARPAIAGTLESGDAQVSVEPTAPGSGLTLAVESAVDLRFTKLIRAAAEAALGELGVLDARVVVRERAALDCTVRARVLAACLRAAAPDGGGANPVAPPWEALR
jgi:citrate lyase subunit gamma (acyl carrier protein)